MVFPAERIAHAAPVPFQLPVEAGVVDPVVPVGKLPGTVAVNPAGSAIYTIPLDLPATRGDIIPPLALVNSPDAGPGQYGYGWSVSGISVIDQCHVANGEYGYCLDGTPLVQVPNEQRSFDHDDGDPSSIANLEEYRTYPDTGLRISRTVEPSPLDPSGTPTISHYRWKVEFPSGRTSHYQGCVGTCIESMITDPHGNYITINAHHDEMRGVVLEEIYYEGNLVTGEPTTDVVRFHDNGIEFTGRYYWFDRAPYDSCGPNETSWSNGCAPTTSGNDGATGYQLLSSVTACAGDFPADGAGPGTECIPPTRFQYKKRPDRLEWAGFDHNTGIPTDPCHGPFFGDFDGDGKTDAIWGTESCDDEQLHFWANGSESWEIESIADVPGEAELLIDDIDGDGSQDIVYFDDKAEVHTISALGGIPQYRTYAAAHDPGDFFQPVLADLNSDGLIDIVSCEGPAKAKLSAQDFPTAANRVYVYLGKVDTHGHRLAPPTPSFLDPFAGEDGKYNEVGCEPGPIQVRHGFGDDIVMIGRTGYFRGQDPTGSYNQGGLQEYIWANDVPGVSHDHDWLGPSPSDQAPIPRAIQIVDGTIIERPPTPLPSATWNWHTDWPTLASIPVSSHDGAGRLLEFPMTGAPWAQLQKRRLRYFGDDFDENFDVGLLPWLPELVSTDADPTFPYTQYNWPPRLEDQDGDGAVDFIGPELLYSFFFDWDADGTSDYIHSAHCEGGTCGWGKTNELPEILAFKFSPGEDGFGDAVNTELYFSAHDLGGGEERVLAPFPAQDDDDAELELWQETDWGDIRVYDRTGFGKSMALASVEDGYGLRTDIGYSPAPSVHTQENCPSPAQSVLWLEKPIVRCLENERQLVHTITEWGGDNGRRLRRYEYVDGQYNTTTRRFLGFDRIIEHEQLSSPAFPGDSSEIIRIRAFEDATTFPEPARLGRALARLPNYELTLYIDDRLEFEGETSDRAELVDHVWGLDSYARRFVEIERHERVYELGHTADIGKFRVNLPSIDVVDGLTPTYETSSYVDATDHYGNIVDSHSVTEGEVVSVHRTYSRVVESPFTDAEVEAINLTGAAPNEAPTRGRWRPSRPASETVIYADGEFVETNFNYTDELPLNTATCTPYSTYDLACDQALALFPDTNAGALGEVRTVASGQEEQGRLFVYDIYGNVVLTRYTSQDGLDIEHHSHYDASRHLYRTGAHGPTGFRSFITWNRLIDKPLAMVDSNGRETHFRYDGLGRLTQRNLYVQPVKHAASITVRLERNAPLDYGDDGLPTPSTERARSTFGDGRWREVRAGAAGLPVEYRWATGGPEGYAASAVEYLTFELGRVYRASAPAFDGEEQVWATVVYDASGRLVRQIQPDGSEFRTRYRPRQEWQYDAEGNPPVRLEYDGFGRVARVYDAKSTAFCYTYDARSNLDKVRKGCAGPNAAEEVDFDYDVFGRLEQLIDPSSGVQTYDYDARGRLRDVVDGNDLVHAWTYDDLDRVVTEATPDGVRTNYYDSPANLPAEVAAHLASTEERPGMLLARTFDGNGSISTARYNDFGDVVQTVDVIDGQTYSHGFSYDEFQRVDGIAYPSPGSDPMVIKLGYDKVGNIRQVRDAGRDETLLTVLTRNARGQVTEVEHFGDAKTRQGHDALGRVEDRTTTLDVGATFDQQYAYSPNGNLESRWNQQSGLQETFGYDQLGRLTSSSLAGTWSYDAYGNPDDVTATPGGQLLSVPGVYSATYDDAGQLTSYSDAARSLQVEWNASGEPEVITSTEPCCGEMSPSTVGKETVELFYGPSGELIRRRATYSDDAAVEHDSVYVGSFESTTREQSDGSSVQMNRWSLPSTGGVTLTATSKSGSETGFAYHAGTADALGSVQSVITAEYDEKLQAPSKSTQDARSYDPWGRPRAETFGVGLPTFDDVNDGFTGHRAQRDGGLVDMNLRHYDPISRRFISPDPVVAGIYDTQAWNRYAYVRNNPLRWVDPTGAFGQSPYNSANQLVAQVPWGAGGALAVLASALASSIGSGAVGRALKSFGRKVRNFFTTSKGSRGQGSPASAPPPYTQAEPSVVDKFDQAARAEAGRLQDLAASGISAIERAWDDPLGTLESGATSYFTGLRDLGMGYVGGAIDHFGGMAEGLGSLAYGLATDPAGTASHVGNAVITGLEDNVNAVIDGEIATYHAITNLDASAAVSAQFDVAVNSYEFAATVEGGVGLAKGAAALTKAGLARAAGGGSTRAFAHGTTASASRDIKSGGLNAEQAVAAEVGSYRPGSFFTHEVGPPSNPGAGMDAAAHWAQRAATHAGTAPGAVVMKVPGATMRRLEAAGHVTTGPVPGLPNFPAQVVFSPEAFPILNVEAIFEVLK